MFTEDELAGTDPAKMVEIIRQEHEELSKKPRWNWFKIRAAEETLRHVRGYYNRAIANPAAENEEWHRKYPDAPRWAHPNDLHIAKLYQELRGFDVVAEKHTVSPGLEVAQGQDSHITLDEASKDRLRRYFHSHDNHGCRDLSDPDDPYWIEQDELDAIISTVPPMSERVTVWRGEHYSPGVARTSSDKQREMERVNYLLRLQKGDPFSWENCAATSLRPKVAANSIFSFSQDPRKFHGPASEVEQVAEQAVLFELDTDRGVHIDDRLVTAAPSNEDEILLPRFMEFEVVGHSQLSSGHVGGNGSTALHLIKLRMRSI